VKARANGADAAAAEEAEEKEETVLPIAAQMIRQPAIAQSEKSRPKQRRKSRANHGRKAGLNLAMIVMKAVRNRAMNAPTAMKAARSTDLSSALSQFCCRANRFPNTSRTERNLRQALLMRR
jgi:hypothetical protein